MTSPSKRWFRKHSRLVTYCGAFIVFATFIVRDGLRDHLRDVAGSIGAANDVFEIREDNTEVRMELRELKNDVLNNNALAVFSDGRLLHVRALQMYYSLGAVSYLIETTQDEGGVSRLKELSHELSQIQYDSLKLDIPKTKVESLMASAIALELKISQFQDETLQHARTKLERTRAWYDASTWISYFLYAIGWGLGLIGKLYGMDGLTTA